MEVFATHATADYVPPSTFNHGRPWSESAKTNLLSDFDAGLSLKELCARYGRTGNSILGALRNLGAVSYDAQKSNYICNYREKQMSTAVATPVNAKVIENVVMIRGHNAASFSDDAIFKLIADLEVEADTLSKIQNKPKKLAKKIEDIHADIKKLVEYVDAR